MSIPTRPRRRRWYTLAVMSVVALLAAAGCAAIPTRGPVGKSDPISPRDNSVNIDFQQFAPAAGASPESIIRGFFESGTGISDDFQFARQYLTPALAQSWAADKRTLVYKDKFAVAPGEAKDSYNVTFDVVSTVDSAGVLAPARPGTKETIAMKMVQVEGEWRIADTPDGIVLQEATFQSLFNPISLYFYDPTFTYGVPDVRWLAGRTARTATAIVRAMLDGPAPYLKGAVVSAFPDGIALERDSVPVKNEIEAQVGLTAQPLLDTGVKQRQQMHAQLLITLQKSLNTVTAVQFLAGDRQVDMGGSDDAVPAMIIDNPVPTVQVAVAKNELVTYDGNKISPIPNLPSVAALAPTAPAISYSGRKFAFLSGAGTTLYSVAPGGPPLIAAQGTGLTPPSFASNGWVWTAAGDGSGTVLAVNPTAQPGKAFPSRVLSVPWLVGQHVTTLRVSRDGTRVLVISNADGVTKVQIAGILKTGDSPRELTVPVALVQDGNPTLGVWVGETSVAVLHPSATAPVAIEILDLAKPAVKMTELKGAQWVSAGSGVRNVHAQTANEFFTNVGNGWDMSAKGLRQASFAG